MPEQAQDLPVDELVDRYVRLRDKKTQLEAAHKKTLEPLNTAMDFLENMILQRLNEQGVESARTAAGTAYKHRVTSVTVADKQAFQNWLHETGQWELADIRAAKTNVTEYRVTHDDVPPGLNYKEVMTVGIRRA